VASFETSVFAPLGAPWSSVVPESRSSWCDSVSCPRKNTRKSPCTTASYDPSGLSATVPGPERFRTTLAPVSSFVIRAIS
jgi:hypothetical protein